MLIDATADISEEAMSATKTRDEVRAKLGD
jgi:hypothetical protein